MRQDPVDAFIGTPGACIVLHSNHRVLPQWLPDPEGGPNTFCNVPSMDPVSALTTVKGFVGPKQELLSSGTAVWNLVHLTVGAASLLGGCRNLMCPQGRVYAFESIRGQRPCLAVLDPEYSATPSYMHWGATSQLCG